MDVVFVFVFVVVALLLAFPSPLAARRPSFGFDSSTYTWIFDFPSTSPPLRPSASSSPSSPWPSPSSSPDGSLSPGNAPLPPRPDLPQDAVFLSPLQEEFVYIRSTHPPPPPPPPPRRHQDSSGPTTRDELNRGQKVGLAFLAAAFALQIVFGGFLLYRKRKIQKVIVGRGAGERDFY